MLISAGPVRPVCPTRLRFYSEMSSLAGHLRISTSWPWRPLQGLFPLCRQGHTAQGELKKEKRMKTRFWTPTKPTGKNKPNRNVRLAVILTEDVEGVGVKGEYVLPKRRYARHELIWKKQAVYATPDNLILYKIPEEVVNDQRLKKAIDERAFLKKYLEENNTITIEQDTDEKNWELWEQDISMCLREQLQLHVPLHCINPDDLPINTLGTHQITIRLNVNDVAVINVEVSKYIETISDAKFKEELQKAIKEL